MKPAPFDYVRPSSVPEALSILAEHGGDARPLAGGQSLVPMMNFRVAKPKVLVDLNGLSELAYHRIDGATLRIGALARHADLENSPAVRDSCPLMAAAYRYVAHQAIRNRGTLCGNLCHADPASEMPAVIQAVDATLHARSSGGVRRVAASEFFRGLYETDLRDGELLVEVEIPIRSNPTGWGFEEVSMRRGDFAVVAVAAVLSLRGQNICDARVCASGIGSSSRRLPEVESFLADKRADEATISAAAELGMRAVQAHSDPAFDASYRQEALGALLRRALRDACGRADRATSSSGGTRQ
jgi:carbon-monoxide dehydrogenase medium subunit